jgi:hypothetical protein
MMNGASWIIPPAGILTSATTPWQRNVVPIDLLKGILVICKVISVSGGLSKNWKA